MADIEGPSVPMPPEAGPIADYVEPKEDAAAAGRKPADQLQLSEAVQEHAEMMTMLPQYVRDVTKKMDNVRMAGIPDPAAYTKLAEDLDQVYQRFSEVSQRIIDYKEGVEDSYRMEKEEERRYEREQEAVSHGRRRETDQAPYEARRTPLELYDEEVRKLLADAIDLEAFVDLYEQKGTLAKNEPIIRGAIAGILDKLKELDANAPDKDSSRERSSLMDVLSKIDDALEEAQKKAVAVSTPLSAVRASHRQVRAQYASVQHTLTEEQRRAMRVSIASMGSAVRQAEDAAWSQMFAAELKPVPPPQPPEDIQETIRLAVAHATEHAPAIATAALAALPRRPLTAVVQSRRGVFAALGDAFRLK